MLTIAKLRPGREDYYLNKVAAGIEDYYTGKGEIAGVWQGRGAARLGLAGEVTAPQLRAALGGVSPTTGDRLVGRPGAKRVPGWDLTFAAPKPVSVLYGLGGPEVSRQVVEAHETAVAEAIRYLERHATVSRRRSERRISQVRAEGLVIAAFRHRTSRAGDPHLHTHALAANIVEHIDGGWGALHSPVTYRHARTAGFVYQAVLRGELTERLGVTWGPVRNGYAEIDGIDRRLTERFSKRHTDIQQELDTAGLASARAAGVAQRRTRTAKRYGVDPLALHQRWETEARGLGLDPDNVVAAATGGWRPTVSDTDLEGVIETMVAPEGLTAQQASFERRDVTRAWCEALPPGLNVSFDALEDLTDHAVADSRVVPVVRGTLSGLEQRLAPARTANGSPVSAVVTQRRWTTTDMLATERRLLNRADNGRGVGAALIGMDDVESVLGGRSDLSAEQIDLVRRLATSGDGVEVVVGRAGAGKTYTMAAAAQVWRAAGYKPIGIALAARAAAELEASAGIPSTTVAQFLIDADQAPGGLLGDRDIVVVDEAGMIDTRRLARVLLHVEVAGGKVILLGDHHQLPAVEAGGAFAALVARLGSSELAENRRQREQWEKDTLDRLRVGAGGRDGIAEMVTTYGDHGRVHIGATPADVRAAMVADWYHARQARAKVGMVALRRGDVDELNCRARALLVANGSVAADGITVAGRTYARGDRVVCLENDRRIGVHNALFAHVMGVDPDGGSLTIAVENTGHRVVVPYRYVEDGHLAHGYATTIHKAQGATYERTLLLGDDRLYRQAGYTALSRGTHRNDMYLVVDDDRDRDPDIDRYGHAPPDKPIQRLVTALHRDAAKVLATDELGVSGHGEVERNRPLRDMWAERDHLATRLSSIPPDRADTLSVLSEATDQARARAAQATLERTAAEERAAAQGGPLRRSDARRAQRDLARAAAHERRLIHECDELDEQRAGVEAHQTERAAILDARGDEVRRLRDLDQAIDRRACLAGRAAEIQRPPHIVDTLGEPPVSLTGRERWREAAAEIESYRARWGRNPADEIDDPGGRSVDQQRIHSEHVSAQVDAAIVASDTGNQACAVEIG